MTAMFMHRRVSRSVGWRLAVGVLPSVVAVLLVVGLFYYGEVGRAAPRVVLAIVSALTLGSIVMAWANTAYFADRLSRLAEATERASGLRGPADEFDRIEKAVGNLGSALTAAEAERARTDAMAAARLQQQATMLAGTVSDSLSQLDQVRLPLQILLESPFGELNDNQEELLRDARAAADVIDMALRRLGQIADIDRGAIQLQHDLVQVNDVVRSVLPIARAAAERNGAQLETGLEPGLPRVMADRARLAEALSLFLTDAAAESGANNPLIVSTACDGASAIVRLSPVGAAARAAHAPTTESPGDDGDSAGQGSAPLTLASRLISAQGGDVSIDQTGLVLRVGPSVAQ